VNIESIFNNYYNITINSHCAKVAVYDDECCDPRDETLVI